MRIEVQMLAVDDIEFLEQHEGQMWFSAGHKIGLDWHRPDGLRVQCSGWTVGEVLNAARAMRRKWLSESNSERQRGSNG